MVEVFMNLRLAPIAPIKIVPSDLWNSFSECDVPLVPHRNFKLGIRNAF